MRRYLVRIQREGRVRTLDVLARSSVDALLDALAALEAAGESSAAALVSVRPA